MARGVDGGRRVSLAHSDFQILDIALSCKMFAADIIGNSGVGMEVLKVVKEVEKGLGADRLERQADKQCQHGHSTRLLTQKLTQFIGSQMQHVYQWLSPTNPMVQHKIARGLSLTGTGKRS